MAFFFFPFFFFSGSSSYLLFLILPLCTNEMSMIHLCSKVSVVGLSGHLSALVSHRTPQSLNLLYGILLDSVWHINGFPRTGYSTPDTVSQVQGKAKNHFLIPLTAFMLKQPSMQLAFFATGLFLPICFVSSQSPSICIDVQRYFPHSGLGT